METAVLINNDLKELEYMEAALKESEPSISCISFVFGDEAVQTVKDQMKVLPQYIFLNINLRRKTGTECLRELMEVKERSRCTIVVVATVMPEVLAAAFLALGADFAFQTPTTRPGFQLMVNHVLQKHAT